ncbi:proteasome maturation protein UMP1 [Acrasis kona]|uniref:Proteasome maturation protein UMP1 n=1 Tax=Acrasis kona TaxID=1008807 RepID=A0AAW2Z2H5_9EUKA
MEQYIPYELPNVSVDRPHAPTNKLAQRKHPVQQALEFHEHMEEKRKYSSMANVYGGHMPIHFEMQKFLVSTPLRLPTIRSSGIAMEILSGADEDIEFEDWLNDPNMSERAVDLHARMERRLGLNSVLPK